LQSLYPEISAKLQDYKNLGYWKDINNQKSFFDQLAIKWNIQKPEEWYKVTSDSILKEGGFFIIRYYNGSVIKGNYFISAN
jgi:hypothetical protein